MTVDAVGNNVKEGDIVLFNGLKYTIKSIKDGNIIGASSIETLAPGKQKIQGMVIPGEIIMELALSFNPQQPLNMYCLRVPSNQEIAKLTPQDN
jgi:hypothetical protein